MKRENNSKETVPILHPEDFRVSINNIADLPDYLEKINQNIMNIEKRISKKEFDTERVREFARINSLRNNNSNKNINEDEEIEEKIPGQENQNEALDLKSIVKASVEGINDIFKPKNERNYIEPIKEENYLSGNIEVKENDNIPVTEKSKPRLKPIINKKKPASAKYPESNLSKKGKNFKLDLSNENSSNNQSSFKNKPYQRPTQKNVNHNYSTNNNNSKIISNLQNNRYVGNNETKTSPNNNHDGDNSDLNNIIDSAEPNPSNLKINKVNKNRGQSKSPLPNKNYQFKPKQKKSTDGNQKEENSLKKNLDNTGGKENDISPLKLKKRETSLNKKGIAQKSKDLFKGNIHSSLNSNNSNLKSPNLKNSLLDSVDSINGKLLSTPETRNKIKMGPSHAGVSKKSIGTANVNNNNNNNIKKTNSQNEQKNKETKNTKIEQKQTISTTHNMCNKSFPKNATSKDIMKLMLFFNEYLVNYASTNLNPKEIEVINSYSKFLSDNIIPSSEKSNNKKEEEDYKVSENEGKYIKIQRKWREYKMKSLIQEKNIENELKKMLISNFVEKEGFNLRKIIGMMNSSLEDFIKIKTKDILAKQLIDINEKTLSLTDTNNLYRNYINYKLLQKNGDNIFNANNENTYNTLMTSKNDTSDLCKNKDENEVL